MAHKHFLVLPLFACSLTLIMGAFNHPPQSAPPQTVPTFLARPLDLDARLRELAPRQLLERAAAALASDKVQWLQIKTWQRQMDEELSFEAEGRLVCGPNNCARLEMTVQAGNGPAQVTMISDGVAFAKVVKLPNQSAKIATERFSPEQKDGSKPFTSEQIAQVLKAKGCGGPHCLLENLLEVLFDLKADTGTWEDRPVIRLSGSVKEGPPVPLEFRLTTPPQVCHLFLDAQTLWPHRVEWCVANGKQTATVLLQVEFREPVLNKPLSQEECVREFSYQP